MSKPERQRLLPGFEAEDVQHSSGASDEREVDPSCARSGVSCDVVYAMDVHYLMFQVFHALPDIRSPSGLPVAAVHGFIQDVIGLVAKKRPDYVFCAFDSPLNETFRRDRFPSYKANREEMPDELRSQVATVRRMLGAMSVPVLASAGYEADDVLATVARESESRGMLCFLVTGDKDCRQLISDRVKIYNIRKDEVFDADALARVWGIAPKQVVDFQALVGDAVDNIPGVPLVGPKTAAQLLTRYGTLDNVLAHADEVPGARRRANLKNARESLLLTRELVRLVDDVPLEIDWKFSRLGEMRQDEIQSLCQELGLHRLAERIAAL